MKWRKETQVYMFAHYFSEDGNWKAWDETKMVGKEDHVRNITIPKLTKWRT